MTRHRTPPALTRAAAGLAAATIASVAFALPASACSCAIDSTPAEYAANADLVIAGRVLKVEGPAGAASADPVTYMFAPTRIWKGPQASTFAVRSAASGASCGLEGVTQGSDYLVYAKKSGVPDVWEANLCGGTARLSDGGVAAVTAALGAGQTPAPQAAQSAAPASNGSNTFGNAMLPIAGIGALLASGVAAVLIGRRRAR